MERLSSNKYNIRYPERSSGQKPSSPNSSEITETRDAAARNIFSSAYLDATSLRFATPTSTASKSRVQEAVHAIRDGENTPTK